MNATLFLALHDLSQRKKETIAVIFAITIGIVGTISTYSVNNGMQDAFVGTVVDVQTGHLAILPDIGEDLIENSDSVVDRVSDLPFVVGVAPRIGGGMNVRSKTGHAGGMIIGIMYSKEEGTTTLTKKIKEGEFLDDDDGYELLMGSVLANDLEVGVSDDVTLTIEEKPYKFNVKGIVSTGSFEYDGYAVFVSYKFAQELLNTTDATEILIRLVDRTNADGLLALVKRESTSTNVKTWEELSEGMASMISTLGIISSMTSFISILVAAIAISLIIYTTVKNRTRDIGILKGIGARNSMILNIFLIEAILIGVIGMALGTVMGLIIVDQMHKHPITITPRSVELIIAPWITPQTVLITDLIMLITCIVGGVIPAIIASRTNIIKAIWGG